MEPQGPGSFYWLAGFFKLFGSGLITARVVLLLTGVATVLLLFHLARRVERLGLFPAVFVLITSIPIMVMNSPHYDSNMFGLIAFALFLSALDRLPCQPRKTVGSLFFLSGVMAGVTTSFVQQKGCFLVISFALALLAVHRENWIRPSLILCSGYFSVLLIELSSYAAAKAIPDLIHANFIWPLTNYNSLNSSPYGYPFFQHMWPQWFAALRLQCPLPIAYVGSFALSVPYLLVLAVPLLLPIMAWCWPGTRFLASCFLTG